MFLHFLAILLVISFGILVEAGVKSFCNATSAKEGEEALISCHFDTDINTIQKDVLVFKVNKEHSVLMLTWYDGKPNIDTKPGYQCDGKISDHIIIKIPKANPDNSGEYKCIVPPSAKGDARGCTLNISGINNGCLLTTFLTFPTTKLAEDTKGTNEDLIAIILGIALGVVIIILLAVVALRKRWIRFPCMREEQRENSTTVNKADTHPLSSSKKIHKNIFEKQIFVRIQRHQHNGVYKYHPTCLQEEKRKKLASKIGQASIIIHQFGFNGERQSEISPPFYIHKQG